MVALKSVKQSIVPIPELASMMEKFRQMINHCIRIGLENNVTTPENSHHCTIMNLIPMTFNQNTSLQQWLKLVADSLR